MSYEKKYAKGATPRKTKPTPDGEIQTAVLGAVANTAMILGAPALGYVTGSAVKLVKDNYKKLQEYKKHNKRMQELDDEDKDSGK
jgi:hypothetical protein|tara:strand:+ start:389 stop:643 length:255 start_codon:yes stop_codon:yes gene_type:complete